MSTKIDGIDLIFSSFIILLLIHNKNKMLTVKNALGKDFDSCCCMLCDKIKQKDYSPDIVIGVLTGGGYVGRIVHYELNLLRHNILYKEIKLQRRSTKAKSKSHIGVILKHLPNFCLDVLRILEVELLELKAKFIEPMRSGNVVFDGETEILLRQGYKKILIVDDCIDTGMTLKTIKDSIQKRYGGTNEIKIAVITTAHRHPVINADFFLYNRVLVRFPWAFDVKI